MKLLPLLLLAFLFIENNVASKWESLEKIKEILNGYQGAAEDALQSAGELVQNTTSDSMAFLSSLDELPIVKEILSVPEGDKCREQFVNLKNLKNSFKLHFSKLEGPLVKRISDINIRFNDLRASLSVYRGLADGKWWACKVEEGKECTEETKVWLEERIKSLICKIDKNCLVKTVVKREVSNPCDWNQYLYHGDCFAIDDYVCDGMCNRGNCRDEPSSGCKRYCIGGFHCKNLKCIKLSMLCNDVDDCGDGSDESGCEEKREFTGNCTLEEGKFLCSDQKKCLDLSSACDGLSDCADGSDEAEACASGDCGAECRAAGGVCLRTPRGQICLSHCPPGTSETPRGCEAGPALPPHALADLLDDLPRMTSRYLASYKLLQARLVDELAAAATRVADCRAGDTLSNIFRLSGYLTTERPHTTTRQPRTTTHHHINETITTTTKPH